MIFGIMILDFIILGIRILGNMIFGIMILGIMILGAMILGITSLGIRTIGTVIKSVTERGPKVYWPTRELGNYDVFVMIIRQSFDNIESSQYDDWYRGGGTEDENSTDL